MASRFVVTIPVTCHVHSFKFFQNSFGGYAVVKNPYSNGGQGVWTITSPQELEEFMKTEDRYDQFIVQSLIGNSKWSSHTHQGQLYHVGTGRFERGC